MNLCRSMEKPLPFRPIAFLLGALLGVLPQSELEFAFAGVSGNTLAEEHS